MTQKAVNLAGARYGLLTVVAEAGRDNFNRYKWLCRCDCGNDTIVASNNLRTGTSKSCGCLRSVPRSRHDITGFRSGKLVVTQYAYTKAEKAYWHCRCDCGTETVKWSGYLKRKTVKSCGCLRPSDSICGGRGNFVAWSRTLREIQECCAKCGAVDGLHAHHVMPFNQNPDLAVDLSNGIVLCAQCHREFHRTYGHKDFGAKELGLWLGLDSPRTSALESLVAYKKKGGAQDIRKVIHYCQLILEMQYGEKP